MIELFLVKSVHIYIYKLGCIMNTGFFVYIIGSLIVYPFAGTPYARAFATCNPYAVVYELATFVIASYFFLAILELDDTAPC